MLNEQSTLEHAHSAITLLQSAFDDYQKSCFVERPSEFFALELCGEAGELANLEKKRWKGKTISQEAFADESADVFIALMNFVNARDINLASAVIDKLQRIEAKRVILLAHGEQY
jgi:NTP pyrophosphatase (non-canonical NTP hydrolase)